MDFDFSSSGKPQSLFAKTLGRQVQTNGQAQAPAQAETQAQGQGQIQTLQAQDGGGEENSVADSKTEDAGEDVSAGLAGAKEMR